MVPKRKRPPCRCSGGLGDPKAKEDPLPMQRGLGDAKAKQAPSVLAARASVVPK